MSVVACLVFTFYHAPFVSECLQLSPIVFKCFTIQSESMTSVYSEAGEDFGIPITGTIQFSLNYDYKVCVCVLGVGLRHTTAPTGSTTDLLSAYLH